MAMQASGPGSTRRASESRWALTPLAWTTEAMGRTMAAEMSPWIAPERTFSQATSQIGQGAWTRSSISRVKPNSWDICNATDWTPWNMIEIPTTPATRTVAKALSPRAAASANGLANLGKDEEEDEKAGTVGSPCEARRSPSPCSERRRRAARGPESERLAVNGERRGPTVMCGTDREFVCGHQSRNSLPVKLMKTVSSEGSATERSTTGKPPDSAAATTLARIRSPLLTCSSTPLSISRCG